MRRTKRIGRWAASAPLTDEQRKELTWLTARRLFLGPLTPAEVKMREQLRLRKLATT